LLPAESALCRHSVHLDDPAPHDVSALMHPSAAASRCEIFIRERDEGARK